MDGNHFDAVIHAFAIAAPRRAALGAGLAALLTRSATEETAARKKRRKRKKKCKGGKKKCGGKCLDLFTDGANCGACGNVCESGGCVHGVCTCESQSDCPGECVCSDHLGGGGICFKGGNNGQPCDSDDDCPPRSACFASNNKCSIPCLD